MRLRVDALKGRWTSQRNEPRIYEAEARHSFPARPAGMHHASPKERARQFSRRVDAALPVPGRPCTDGRPCIASRKELTVTMAERLLDEYLSERVLKIGSSGIRRAFDLAKKSRIEDLISLGLGEPDFDTPAFVKDAAKRAIDEGFNRYTANAGIPELREAVARKLAFENQVSYDPESEIIITVGAINAIHLAILATINPGDEVLLPDPYFVAFEPCVIMAGGRAVHVPLREENDFRLRAEDLVPHITPRTKMVIVNTPHNPTGAVLGRADLEAIAAVACEHQLFVLSDEVYEKLVYAPATHVSMASLPNMRERTVTIHSFSKAWCMCGWRIGYAAAPARIVEQMVKLQQFNSVHAPSYAQRAALAALQGPQDFLATMAAEFDRRRRFMVGRVNAIEGLSCREPLGCFYVFPNIKALGVSSQEASRLLLTEGKVVTVPGSALGTSGEGYLRLSYTVPLDRLEVAMDRIEATVKKIRGRELTMEES
jgi:aminotransferase